MVKKRFTKKLKKGGDANHVTAITRLVNNEVYTVDNNNNDNIFIKKEKIVIENIPKQPVIEPIPEPQNTIEVQPEEEKQDFPPDEEEEKQDFPPDEEEEKQDFPDEEEKQDFPNEEEKQIEPEIQNTRNIDLEIDLLKDTINKKQNNLKNVINYLKVVKNRIALNEKSLNNYSSKNRITRKLKNIFYDKYENEKINIKKEIQMLKQDIINYENEKIQIENEIQNLENKINEKINEKIKENQTQIDDDDEDMFNDVSKAGRRTRRKKSKKVQKKSLKKLPKKTKTKK